MKRTRQLAAVLYKESLGLLRDRHALLILIVMPAVFVLIMSLALQDTFANHSPRPMRLLLLDRTQGVSTVPFIHRLRSSPDLRVTRLTSTQTPGGRRQLRERVLRGEYALGLVLEPAPRTTGFAASAVRAILYLNPTLPPPLRGLAISVLHQATAQANAQQYAAILRALGDTGLLKTPLPGSAGDGGILRLKLATAAIDGAPVPTSAQQNAPAWALLAMFFLVIPLSVTMIQERQQGCLLRIRSLPVPSWVLIAGKIVPFFLLNSVQLLLVLWEGTYLLPLFGGDALTIGHAPGALLLIASAANLAAIAYGLLVATAVRTEEQGTGFGALSVLMMAALGGILVPKMVMPAMMQRLTVVSPMSWALHGFQTIFVRGGDIAGIMSDCERLLVFSIVCLGVAAMRLRRSLSPD